MISQKGLATHNRHLKTSGPNILGGLVLCHKRGLTRAQDQLCPLVHGYRWEYDDSGGQGGATKRERSWRRGKASWGQQGGIGRCSLVARGCTNILTSMVETNPQWSPQALFTKVLPGTSELSSFFNLCHRLQSCKFHLLSVSHQAEFLSMFVTLRIDKTKISSTEEGNFCR